MNNENIENIEKNPVQNRKKISIISFIIEALIIFISLISSSIYIFIYTMDEFTNFPSGFILIFILFMDIIFVFHPAICFCISIVNIFVRKKIISIIELVTNVISTIWLIPIFKYIFEIKVIVLYIIIQIIINIPIIINIVLNQKYEKKFNSK